MDENIKDLLADLEPIDIRCELFRKGDFGFIVEGIDEDGNKVSHEKQREALEMLTSGEYDEFLYGGAAGGAKTWTGCTWILFMCLCYPGIKVFIGRNELKDILDSVFVTFNKVARTYGCNTFKFNAVKNFIQFDNGSHINFIEVKYKPSDPMYEDVGSTEYTIGWGEEVGEWNETAATVLSSRVGRHLNTRDVNGKLREKPIKGTVLWTCNPKRNWAKRDFHDKHKNGTLEPNKAYLQCLVTENPFIEKEYIEKLSQLSKKDKALFERYFKGNWEYESNPYQLTEQEMIDQITNNDHSPFGKRCITADVARFGSDKARIGFWSGWRLKDVISLDISKTTDVELAIKTLRHKYKIPRNRVVIDQDGVGCLTETTEVLTTRGWVQAKDLTKQNVIITKDEKGYLDYIRPNDIWHLDNEKFIETESGYSFTVGHLHYFKTRKEYDLKLKYWDDITDLNMFYNDTSINLPTEVTEEYISISQYRKNPLEFKKSVYAYFLGWMATDGSLDGYNNKNVIRISQVKISPNIPKIEKMLNDMGVNWIRKLNNKNLYQYEFQNKEIFDFIKNECYSGKPNFETKKVCNYIKRQPKEYILKYLEAVIEGDGYYHRGLIEIIGTNKTLIDGFQELMFYCGIESRIGISHKKGSKGKIGNREITRTRDCYNLYEVTRQSPIKIGKKKEYFAKAVNILLPNETKVYLVRMNQRIFWTHNGGVVDATGGIGFKNNGRPIRTGKDMPNYKNLQVQCLYHLADKVNEGLLQIDADISPKELEEIKEELSQIQSKGDQDPERKLDCKNKGDIKHDIGRSPDWRDMMLMRAYFDLKKSTAELTTTWE